MGDTLDAIKKYVETVDEAETIVHSEAPWDTKYDLIFGPIKNTLVATGLGMPDYCDPDASYQDDTMAFFNAIKQRADDYRMVLAKQG